MKIRAIDLFCGGGGSSWGAKAAGVQLVAGFDLWPFAGKTYAANHVDAEFIPGRLEDVNVKILAKRLGKVDLILASPECTNHSPAKGNKPRCELSKNTAFEVLKFAKAFCPRWIVIENVVNMRKWKRYNEFKSALELLGYKLREQVLNSADFGVPQSRRRLFLLCDQLKTPLPTSKVPGRKLSASSFVSLNENYKWSPLKTEKRAAATLQRAERGIAGVGSLSPFLMVYYGSDHAGGWQRLSRPLRTVTTLDRFAVVKPCENGHKMRMLQVPELQAAMGMHEMQFPHGTRRDKIRIIGNGVCPPVMRRVIRDLICEKSRSKSTRKN